jgi:hypothetical protein
MQFVGKRWCRRSWNELRQGKQRAWTGLRRGEQERGVPEKKLYNLEKLREKDNLEFPHSSTGTR